MVQSSRRDRVGLGLIGLGPNWDQSYREILNNLQNRLRIRLIYDSVEARARSAANEFDADVAVSLRQILTRPSLQGLLVVDPGWCASSVLSLIPLCDKPVFLAAPVLHHHFVLRQLVPGMPHGNGLMTHDQLMPELRQRFTPASCRLRELIATRLGPVRRIVLQGDLSVRLVELAALVDWCCHLIGRWPSRTAPFRMPGHQVPGLEFEFPPHEATAPRTAVLRHHPVPTPRIEVECERGRATLHHRSHIDWQTNSESGEESLADERTEFEILIDQFCRRALGGLNPVGRLSDFVKAIEIAKSVRDESA